MKRFIPFVKTPARVSVIRLNGVIATGRGGALNDTGLASNIEKAFRKGKPAAVALQINSPGGSPVQSSLIGARIRRLADEHDIPVLAFVEDVAASGGYWLASSADEIFVDPSSITGSIGVISASFGFSELMAKQGIERRVYTAGKDKSMLDPFRPEREDDVIRLKALQQQIHDNFKEQITSRRGAKLADDRDLFTGEIWVGAQAINVGLVDAVGHLVPTLKSRFGDDVAVSVFGPKRSIFQRFGANIVDNTLAQVNDRALWAQYGL